MTRHCIIPALRIPCPGDLLCTQFISDGWHCLLWHQISLWSVRWMWCIDSKRCINSVTIRRDSTILDQQPIAIKPSYYTVRCVRKFWYASADQPEVVQERATEGSM